MNIKSAKRAAFVDNKHWRNLQVLQLDETDYEELARDDDDDNKENDNNKDAEDDNNKDNAAASGTSILQPWDATPSKLKLGVNFGPKWTNCPSKQWQR